jgi:hypothetical protein
MNFLNYFRGVIIISIMYLHTSPQNEIIISTLSLPVQDDIISKQELYFLMVGLYTHTSIDLYVTIYKSRTY